MAVRSTDEEFIPGTNSRKTFSETLAEKLKQSMPGFGGNSSGPAFLRNSTAARVYTDPGRKELMTSRYVNDWRDWIDPDGKVRRVDYGLFYFIAECCFTYPEGEGISEGENLEILTMPHPSEEPTYCNALFTLAALWQTERLLFIDKSRRVLCSWLLRCCDTWDVLFHAGRKLYLMAENQGDGENFIYRSCFQLSRIPTDRLSKSAIPSLAIMRSKTEPGSFEKNSKVIVQHSRQEVGSLDSFIEAVPKNEDLRGKGASRVTIEECATIRNLESLYTGIMPTMQGRTREDGKYVGGQLVLIGTPDALSFAAEIRNNKISNHGD